MNYINKVFKNLKVHQLEKYTSYRVPTVVFCVIFSGDIVYIELFLTMVLLTAMKIQQTTT
jgi:hypothetical protein